MVFVRRLLSQLNGGAVFCKRHLISTHLLIVFPFTNCQQSRVTGDYCL
jgi:hypothetical protein